MVQADLLSALRSLDEVTLIEILNLKTEEIVDAFLDKIEDNEQQLLGLLYENE